VVGSTRNERIKAREHLPAYQKLSGWCGLSFRRATLRLTLVFVKGCDIIDSGQALQYQIALTSTTSAATLIQSVKGAPALTSPSIAPKVLPTAPTADVGTQTAGEQQQKPPLKRL
jgi:hypothetical protein